MTHQGMSGTHGLRVEPSTMVLDEHSKLQVIEERSDTKDLDQVWDHELPLLVSGLTMEEVVEHIPCGPANKEVYPYRDWVDRYMTKMETPRFIGSVDINGVAMEERANLLFQEFFRGMLRFRYGGMKEQPSEEFVQLMIAWLIKGIEMDFGISERVVWDPSIKGSIHYWVARRREVIQWFIWDPGIGIRMHFLVDSYRLLEDKQSLAREDCNVPKSDMHANPKNDMHANPINDMHANPKSDMHANPKSDMQILKVTCM